MTNTVANVVAGKPKVTGGVYKAPSGTALPTDSSTALAAGYVALGYAGDAGLVEQVGRTTSPVKAWGGDLVKVLQTDYTVTYQVSLIETLNTDVQKAVNGEANVSGTAPATAVQLTSAVLEHAVWAFEIADGDASIRIVVPDGQVTTVGDVTYSDGAVAEYALTIQAFPDANGVSAYKYLSAGA